MTLPDRRPEDVAFASSFAHYLKRVEEAMRAQINLQAAIAIGLGYSEAANARLAEAAMTEALQAAMARADLLGRAEVVRAAVRMGAVPVARAAGTLPRVPFMDAVADILTREPILAQTAAEVAEAYSSQHVFAMAKSTAEHVTDRARRAIAEAIHKGWAVDDGVEALVKIGRDEVQDWTRAYAETVLRTNTTTATVSGRFAQMQEPSIAYAIGALEYVTAGDVDVRPNHRALDGMVAAPDDPVWDAVRPPNGYNCRCTTRYVGWPELERRRLLIGERQVRRIERIPEGGGPDPGFRKGA